MLTSADPMVDYSESKILQNPQNQVLSKQMNLLSETVDALSNSGKSRSDVRWIGSTNYGYFDWEHFVKIADVEYDDGYGAAEVARDLVVVGDDWWLERKEYDGSEWWVFKQLPTKPQNKIEPNRVTSGYDRSLRELNE